MIMKKLSCLILILALIVFASTAFAGIWGESVSDDDLHDGRSFLGAAYDPPYSIGGLEGFWPSIFSIQWDIEKDPASSVWTYEYTLYSARKDISHFILELSESGNYDDLSWGPDPVEGPRFWDGTNGNSDPSWPDGISIYGIKFDSGGSYVTYTIETTRNPVWGNFYVKSGQDDDTWVYAHNNALAIENFARNAKLDFIVRPDGGSNAPVVPEPASALLFFAGSAVFAYRRYFKKI